MNKKNISEIPRFKDESAEADWWASPAGRAFAKRKSAEGGAGKARAGASVVANLIKRASVQIALRLPEAGLERARKIAGRKGESSRRRPGR